MFVCGWGRGWEERVGGGVGGRGRGKGRGGKERGMEERGYLPVVRAFWRLGGGTDWRVPLAFVQDINGACATGMLVVLRGVVMGGCVAGVKGTGGVIGVCGGIGVDVGEGKEGKEEGWEVHIAK